MSREAAIEKQLSSEKQHIELWEPNPISLFTLISWSLPHPTTGSTHKGVNQRSKDVTQTQQQRPESPTVSPGMRENTRYINSTRVQELCESRDGRPGLSVLMSLTVSADVKQHWTMLRHWSQFVPNMSTDIQGHEALHHHHHYHHHILLGHVSARSCQSRCVPVLTLPWVFWPELKHSQIQGT